MFTPETCSIVFVKEYLLNGNEVADLILSLSTFDASWADDQWYGLKYGHDSLSTLAMNKLNTISVDDHYLL